MSRRIADYAIRGDFAISDVVGEMTPSALRKTRSNASELLRSAHPVLCDDVARLYLSDPSDPGVDLFPCAVPPWDLAWFEWRMEHSDYHNRWVKEDEQKLPGLQSRFPGWEPSTEPMSIGWMTQSRQNRESGHRTTWAMAFVARVGRRPRACGLVVEMITDASGAALPRRFMTRNGKTPLVRLLVCGDQQSSASSRTRIRASGFLSMASVAVSGLSSSP